MFFFQSFTISWCGSSCASWSSITFFCFAAPPRLIRHDAGLQSNFLSRLYANASKYVLEGSSRFWGLRKYFHFCFFTQTLLKSRSPISWSYYVHYRHVPYNTYRKIAPPSWDEFRSRFSPKPALESRALTTKRTASLGR